MVGDNLFGAMFNLIKKIMLDADPFKQTAIAKLKESLHVTATVKNQVSLQNLVPFGSYLRPLKNFDRIKKTTV